LAGDFYGGYFTPSDATGDIHQFTTGLATAAQRLGVECLFERDVQSVTHQAGRITIRTAHAGQSETRLFDAVVVCAGTASRAIAAGLGDRLNVYPVKGYSITVQLNDAPSRASAPTVSLLDDETKLVSSRLGEHRLRVAGTAEFNGYNRDIRADRIQPLTDWVAQCFPGVRTENVVPWAGLRPMMPDMMPRVGPGKSPCVFYNTGHGHLGWTLCAITAEMVADAVQGSPARAVSVPILRQRTV
jgi:D-amino-acid dehydrogenase